MVTGDGNATRCARDREATTREARGNEVLTPCRLPRARVTTITLCPNCKRHCESMNMWFSTPPASG